MNQKFTTIFKCVSGSHAYGTSTETSDVDVRGVVVPYPKYLLGLSHFEQKDKWEDGRDRTMFDLRKFAKLALDCNPNIIEMLFMPEDCVLEGSSAWDALWSNRSKFLSTKAQHTYGGYAYSQLKRIRSHRQWLLDPPDHAPTREEFDLPGRKLPLDLFGVLQALEQNQQAYVESARGFDEIGVTNPGAIWELYQKEKKYNVARKNWSQYQSWKKNRNPVRAELESKFGYDTKHASHLMRLLLQGRELLYSGNIPVRLEGDQLELVKAVREGRYTYDQIEEMAAEFQDHMVEAAKLSTLPKKPDFDAVEALVCGINCLPMYPDFTVHQAGSCPESPEGCADCALPCRRS